MLKIYADASFRMGQAHEICEDYAAAGGHGDNAVVAVCDGCSSGVDTDIGARALARSAVRLLSLAPATEAEAIERLVADDAIRAARALNADHKAVFATLMTVAYTPKNWLIRCWGDGIIGYRNLRTGELVVKVIVWPKDQPYYPAYSTLGVKPSARPSKTTILFGNGEVDVRKCDELSDVSFFFCLSHEETDLVFVGSDGWSSFAEKQSREPVPVQDVMARLLPFRSTGPAFVRRRMGAFMRSLGKTSWTHSDDLSLAAICRTER